MRTSFHFLTITGIVPIGTALIVTFPDKELHPEEFVTVKLNVPGDSPEIVVVVPVPVVIVPPGFCIRDHVPAAGSPVRTTFPEVAVHVGCVIVPVAGAPGVTGCVLITTAEDDAEMQEEAFVTVKVYVPDDRELIVVEVPVPVVVVPPGERVIVHVPVAGKPLIATLPVASMQVGWVEVPITGTEGVAG